MSFYIYLFLSGGITNGEMEADKAKRAKEREEQQKRREQFEARKSTFSSNPSSLQTSIDTRPTLSSQSSNGSLSASASTKG